MRDTMYFSSTPNSEECSQLGDPNYERDSKLECQALKAQLRRKFGPEPEGVRLYTKGNPHDFGTYYELQADYITDSEEAIEYVFGLDKDFPEFWDEEALQFLKENNYNVQLIAHISRH